MERPRLEAFRHTLSVQTRWHDNDAYGHVNNVVYYSYFDTAVNRFLVDQCGLGVPSSRLIGVVVETGCRYFEPISFPDELTVGLNVASIGRSSVHYDLALFRDPGEPGVAAGYLVHVFTDRETRRSQELPTDLREALSRFQG